MASSSSVVTVGGKGSSLYSASVYAIANNAPFCKVSIDSSILDKLSHQSHSKKAPKTLDNSPPSIPIPIPPPSNTQNPISTSKFLTLEESRASLIVLLNKLLLASSDSGIRPVLPLLIQQTLNLGFQPETLDFSSTFPLLQSICSLNGKKVEDVGVTVEEMSVIDNSLSAFLGICALLDCSSLALATVVDAVAALSCEAVKADVGAFDLPVSGEGFSVKDETDVASDMKDLLFGSKFVGCVNSYAFSDIPTIHGSLRGAARAVHSRMRVELNSIVKGRKMGCGSSLGKGKALVGTVLPLAMSLQSVGECSLVRAKLTLEGIDDGGLRSQVAELFENSCPSLEWLGYRVQSISAKAALESDFVLLLHEIYDLLVRLRVILAWEAALALFSLEVVESNESSMVSASSNVEVNGGNVNVERKSERKKKRVLGKGTAVIMQLFKAKFRSQCSLTVLVEWARELSLFFDPKDPDFDTLLKKVKEIVESNEVRRLPKIPKMDALDDQRKRMVDALDDQRKRRADVLGDQRKRRMDALDDQTKRRKNFFWNGEMDKILIKSLLHQISEGNKIPNGFKDVAYNATAHEVNQHFGLHLTKDHIKNRVKTLKASYKSLNNLLGESGFGWDSVTKSISVSKEVSDTYIIAHPESKRFLTQRHELYEVMHDVFGEDHTNGQRTRSNKDARVPTPRESDNGDSSSPCTPSNENLRQDDLEGNNELLSNDQSPTSSTEVPTTSSPMPEGSKGGTSTPQRKRLNDAYLETMEKVANSISEMAAAINRRPHTIIDSSTLFASVQEVDGFDTDFLDSVFEYLSLHPDQARIFMVYDIGRRKNYLNRNITRFG
ncbi:histidine--tRNA ligase, cytoplasmic-like isoform X2 [Tasmannia lanceolata]|uniref:histidine--tRNA ligase, cytoplasmic-like isoform X2 n=1 Tax=Tasmannia lanceolata TaxID=3420 RepID=UPI00406471C0